MNNSKLVGGRAGGASLQNAKLSIAIVTPGGVTSDGETRAIPALVQLVDRLAQRHRVVVWTLDQTQPRVSARGGATIRRLDTRGTLPGFGVTALAPRLLAELRRNGPFDVIHAFWAGSSGAASVLAGRALSIPSLLSVGGGELVWLPEIGYGGSGLLHARLRTRMSLRLAGAVTGGSHWVLRALPGKLRASVVPLGIDADALAAPVVRPAGPPWRLAHVADLNRVKDQPMLLRALRRLLEREPDTVLEIAGEDILSGSVQRLAAQMGLAEHVVFHGRLSRAALGDLFRRAHLHVLSSRHESQGVVVAEAAAAGLATAGTCVGSIADLAPGAATAVAVGDDEALSAAMLALLRDTPRREAIARAAQRWAREHDAGWTARRFEQLYGALMASRPHSPVGMDSAIRGPTAAHHKEPFLERSDRS